MKKNKRFVEKLQNEIIGYGFKYSLKDFYKTLVLFFLALIIIGVLFRLKISMLVIIFVVGILSLPSIIIGQYKYLYEQKRFADAATYIEQMIYNFKKRPKILDALIETKNIFESGMMHECINDAISKLQDGFSFEEALFCIEDKYECSHIQSLHRFIVKVEKTGGSYMTGLNILYKDNGAWIQRTYKYQSDRKRSKRNVILAIFLSLGLLLFYVSIIPEQYKQAVILNIIPQVAFTSVIIISFLIYVLLVTKLNGSWLINDVASEKEIEEKYKYIKNFDKLNNQKKSIKKVVILSPLLLIGALLNNIYVILLCVCLMLAVYRQPQIRYKNAVAFLSGEVQKSISDWLRDLIIDIPNNNVRLALENSISSAPYVMKAELENLVSEIDKDPISIRPYQEFFKEINIPEIKRPIQMIYSLTELGVEDTEIQLNELIEQNNVLIASAEDTDNENSASSIHLMHFIPSVVTGIALAAVLLIFIIVLIGDLGSKI